MNFNSSAKSLYANNTSTITISAVPSNAFGWKVPFRNSYTRFEITKNKNLVEIIFENNKKGILKLKAKNQTGQIIIHAKSKYSILPSSFEIPIYSKNTSL